MTIIDAGSTWLVGDIGDPGLQRWLRQKVRTHLFITQARIEADDLVQEMNLHLLESLSTFPSSDKAWPHFCRSLVFRKIRHAHQSWSYKTKQPVEETPEATAPMEARKRLVRAIPRPDPSLRLSRLLGSEDVATVAKQTGIPAKTLLAPIGRMRGAMQRRYPEVYGAPKHQIGYRGMIRWNPPSCLPQPQAPEPTADSGVVVWFSPTQPELVAGRAETLKTLPTKQTQKSQQIQAPTERTAKPARNKKPARRRASAQAQQSRRQKKRALPRLTRPMRHTSKPKNRPARPIRTTPPTKRRIPLPAKSSRHFQGQRNQHSRPLNHNTRSRARPGRHRAAS